MSHDANPTSKMTIEEARSVTWPFRDLRGQPMGLLLDKGLIVLKDLGFAAERAYNARVRAAARTLLLHQLTQAQDEATVFKGPLNVVESGWRSFAQRRQLQIFTIYGVILGFIVVFPLTLIISQILSSSTNNNSNSLFDLITTPAGVIALVLVIGIVIFITFAANRLLSLLISPLERQLEAYRQGQFGEERVLNALYHSLDSDWWLFRNMEIPGTRYGDVDLILVGTYGIWIFEVKAYSGDYRNQGDHWERLVGKRWLSTFSNPSRQAKRNAARLSHLLKTHDIKQWVQPIIIWANAQSSVSTDNPSVHVWELEQLSDKFRSLFEERPLPQGKAQKIVDVLSEIYAKQSKSTDRPDT